MYEKLTEEEISFMENFYSPDVMIECLIPENINNPNEWKSENCKLVTLRPYQMAMLSFDSLYANDDRKTEKENFKIKKGAGDIINIAARNIGKTAIGLVPDAILRIIYDDGAESCISSFDQKHLEAIAEKVANVVENHKFFEMYALTGQKKTVARNPHSIRTKTGHLQVGVNEQTKGKNPGTDFHGLHYKSLNIDEASYMSNEGTKKRVDSGSSIGYIERYFGIPEIVVGRPLGDMLRDPDKKNFICRLPQSCIAEDSCILMSDLSTKKIQDINIGDEIYTVSEFKPHKLNKAIVENKIYNGVKKTVLIDNGVNSLYLTEDHKMLVKMSPMYRSWKSTSEMDFCKHEAYYFRKFINNLDDYYKGVFLGFLETEGSFKRNGREKSIGQKDEQDALRWILKRTNIKFTEYLDKKDKLFSYFYLLVENNDKINDFYNQLYINKDVQLGFIAGCILGDGSIHLNNKTKHKDIVIVQKNKCDIIEKILKLADIKHSRCRRIQETNRGFFDGYVYLIGKYEVPICVPYSKKARIYKELIQDSTLASIQHSKISIINEKTQRVYDLTTSSGTFVANGFLVHNCRPDWDEDQKQKMIKEYGGEHSNGMKVNVLADLIDGGEGKYDIERIKKNCWNYEKRIKFFELEKKLFEELENLEGNERKKELDIILSKKLIIERLPSDKCIVSSDIGTSASPSEVCIFFYINGKWRYEYQISLFKMTVKEQAEIFSWIYTKLNGCFISLDCNSAEGKSIRDELIVEHKLPEDILSNFGSNNNLEVDFIRDEKGKIKRDRSGKPLVRTERTLDWGILQLEKILYEGLIEIPHDEKFLKEFSQYWEIKTGNRTRHGSSTTDHLHDSFVLFALCAWENEYGINKIKRASKRCLIG